MAEKEVIIVNSTSGETTKRSMSAAEILEIENNEKDFIAFKESVAAKQAKIDSAKNKLAAIGLTDEEIAALVGGN